MEEQLTEYELLDIEAKNPKNSEGRYKNYKLVIATLTDYEEEEFLVVEGTEWAYFDTVEEIKEYLSEDRKKEITECFEGAEEISFEICSVNKPFPNKVLEKRFIAEKEDDTFFCPYCGKWRYTTYDDNNNEVCSVCGVSTDNYDVKLWKYKR